VEINGTLFKSYTVPNAARRFIRMKNANITSFFLFVEISHRQKRGRNDALSFSQKASALLSRRNLIFDFAD
ncbi:MAG: hypothetical protein ACI90V_004482, partial [Bacillariaceae sp.]|jgi:hypothetical protein